MAFAMNTYEKKFVTEKVMDENYEALANGKKDDASTDFRDKLKGAILGMAIGDALGSPIEFTDKMHRPWIDKMETCPHWKLGKGYYTDDAALGFNIMQGYIDDPKNYNVKNVAIAFAKWLYGAQWSSTDFTFGIGSNCGAGIRAFVENGTLKNGTEQAQGNGAIMRFAPSWVIAHSVYHSKEKHSTKEQLRVMYDINDIDHNGKVCRDTIRLMSDAFDSNILSGKKFKATTKATSWRDASNSGWCVASLDSALWAFKTTNNFRDCVLAAVNLAGDSDSIGSVAAQIAGCYYGFKAIPKDWIADMHGFGVIEEFTEKFLDTALCDK